MKRVYLKPTVEVFIMNTRNNLLAGSTTENANNAENISEGSFGARGFDLDDED